MSSQQRQSPGFGKRGAVTPPPPVELPEAKKSGGNDAVKWIGGGVAAVAVCALVGAGTGGGGSLLGGLLGGILGHKLAQGVNKAPAVAAQPAARAAPANPSANTTTVQRGGFGTTSASSGSTSGS